jgi:hypothetical protein
MKLLTLAAVVLMSFTTSAYSATDKAAAYELCDNVAYLAKASMNNRQSGISLSYTLGIIDGYGGDAAEIGRAIVIDAYNRPRWNDEARRESASVDFETEYLLACMKAMN